MSYVGDTLREMARLLAKLNRRIAGQRMRGPVVERDEKKWAVRVALGDDPETGEQVLSDWISPRAESAGALKRSSVLPSMGENVWVVSPSGDVGADSYIEPASWSDANKRPEQKSDEAIMTYHDNKQTLSPSRQRFERTGAKKSAVDVRSEGRVALEVHQLKGLKIRVHETGEWFRIKPEALMPTTEDE